MLALHLFDSGYLRSYLTEPLEHLTVNFTIYCY